ETRPALIYTPRSEGPHPVLCFLHGAGEAATNRKRNKDGQEEPPFPQFIGKLLANESPPWQANENKAYIRQFMVVCPQLERRRRWTPNDASWVDDLVYEALRFNRGDRRRLILSGFSYGGEGAFQVASASALAWKAIWAVDPAIQDGLPPYPHD